MKLKIVLSSLALAALLATPAFAVDPATEMAVMEKAVDLYIQPGYERFHQNATALTRETSRFCAAPSDDQLKRVQARFGDLAESWAHIAIIQTGPVLEENRMERILFYPDRKSIGLKQVQALLASEDDTVADPKGLASRSIAIQGLGAFEYLFFGAYSEGVAGEKSSFRCRYALAIAKNIEGMSEALDVAWHDPEGVSKAWKQPSPDNPVYRDGSEATAALIGIHVHGIEALRDQRLQPFYKGRQAKILPKAALFWRSGNTMRMAHAMASGLGELWTASDMAALLPADGRSLANSVAFDYKSAARALAKLEQPTAENLADPKYLGRLDFVELTLKDALHRIDHDVAMAIGLGAGFSFADGD